MSHAPFGNFYAGRTVLVTGHTGFKGSWLCVWLKALGAKVVGYALPPITEPSMFELCGLEQQVTHIVGDIRDHAHLAQVVAQHRPEIIIHLAAQALVIESVRNPRETFEVNFMGSMNVLDVAVRSEFVAAVVAITSDKCYRNVGWEWGYREIDPLGGVEAYSASKAAAENGIGAYQHAAFQAGMTGSARILPIASARAGNVVGGGDWSEGRLVPDVIRAISAKRPIALRSPNATRPWQHVLEPLSGYLCLGAKLATAPEPTRYASGWNFGPIDRGVHPVLDVVQRMVQAWPAPDSPIEVGRVELSEAMLLALDCSKARSHLGWSASWDIAHTVAATTDWYRRYYENHNADMLAFSTAPISQYVADAHAQGQAWAC